MALYLFIIYANSVSVKSYEYQKKTSTRNRRKAELRSNGMPCAVVSWTSMTQKKATYHSDFSRCQIFSEI